VAIPIDSDFWEDLLVFIEEGKVIPVIGEGVVTFGPDNQNLYGWLAKSLAKKLQVPPDSLPATPTLNDVVCRHLLRGGARNAVVVCRVVLADVLRNRGKEDDAAGGAAVVVEGLRGVFSAMSALSPAPL